MLRRIYETIFALSYTKKASRPNVPVNVLVSLQILKNEFGWDDEVLYQQLQAVRKQAHDAVQAR